MSLYIGKNTLNVPIIHTTSSGASAIDMKNGAPLSNTLFLSSETYVKVSVSDTRSSNNQDDIVYAVKPNGIGNSTSYIVNKCVYYYGSGMFVFSSPTEMMSVLYFESNSFAVLEHRSSSGAIVYDGQGVTIRYVNMEEYTPSGGGGSISVSSNGLYVGEANIGIDTYLLFKHSSDTNLNSLNNLDAVICLDKDSVGVNSSSYFGTSSTSFFQIGGFPLDGVSDNKSLVLNNNSMSVNSSTKIGTSTKSYTSTLIDSVNKSSSKTVVESKIFNGSYGERVAYFPMHSPTTVGGQTWYIGGGMYGTSAVLDITSARIGELSILDIEIGGITRSLVVSSSYPEGEANPVIILKRSAGTWVPITINGPSLPIVATVDVYINVYFSDGKLRARPMMKKSIRDTLVYYISGLRHMLMVTDVAVPTITYTITNVS